MKKIINCIIGTSVLVNAIIPQIYVYIEPI